MRASESVRQTTSLHPTPLVVHAMTPGVVQIPGDVSVRDAARIMQKEHAPCLLVKESPANIGIITHTDIVYKVAAQDLDPTTVQVTSIMSWPVHTIEFDQATETATTSMASKGVPLLIVTKHKQPIGVLTTRDLVFAPHQTLPRISVSFQIHEGRKRSSRHVARFTQLSHAGAFIETASPPAPGTRLSMSFYLPNSPRTILAKGIVTMSREEPHPHGASHDGAAPAGMEVQFSRLSAADQSQITAWVLRTLYKQTGEV